MKLSFHILIKANSTSMSTTADHSTSAVCLIQCLESSDGNAPAKWILTYVSVTEKL